MINMKKVEVAVMNVDKLRKHEVVEIKEMFEEIFEEVEVQNRKKDSYKSALNLISQIETVENVEVLNSLLTQDLDSNVEVEVKGVTLNETQIKEIREGFKEHIEDCDLDEELKDLSEEIIQYIETSCSTPEDFDSINRNLDGELYIDPYEWDTHVTDTY